MRSDGCALLKQRACSMFHIQATSSWLPKRLPEHTQDVFRGWPALTTIIIHPSHVHLFIHNMKVPTWICMYFTFLLLKITDLLFLRLYFYDIEFGQSFSCLIFHRGRRLRPKEPVMVSSRKGSIFVRVACFWCCHETSQIPEKLLPSYQFCSTLLCASLHRKNRMLRRFFKSGWSVVLEIFQRKY